LILHSYAKLNLYLEVRNIRHDQYHNIKTIFERIDLSDKIILKPRRDKKIKIICSSPEVPQDHTNLAYQSARLLQESFNIDTGVDIKITKRIPVGAGLGGGSSNAAAVLLGLNKFWRLHLKQEELLMYAKRLGCDVPFFIYDTSLAQGLARGDRIKPLKMPKNLRLWHILVIPKINISSARIYREWDSLGSLELTPHLYRYSKKNNKNEFDKGAGLTKPRCNANILLSALRKFNLARAGEALFNSLEQVTPKLYPAIIRIKEKLRQGGIKAILMSGSGPAVFGLVSSRREAQALCRQLKAESGFWQVFVTRTR